MQAERDALMLKVVPQLDEFAAEFGQNIKLVDLRWGVNTTNMKAEESNKKVLKVCLDEIEKAHPYMIILMGERYGWVPDDKDLMRRVAKEKKHELDDLFKSVTELEIEYGALAKNDMLKNCLFYFREQLNINEIPQEYRDIYIEEKEELKQKLEALKLRIVATGAKIKNYKAEWCDEKSALTIPQAFCDMVIADVKTLFVEEFKKATNMSMLQKEQMYAELFVEQKAAQFAARFDLKNKYERIINDSAVSLLHLKGAPGSGKSTFMSKLAQDYKSSANVFFFACGNTTHSQTAFDFVRGAVYFMEELLKSTSHYGAGQNSEASSFEKWVQTLEDLCEHYSEKHKKPALFFVDALDQLSQDEKAQGLKFLPKNIPNNVKFIISSLSDYEINSVFYLSDKCAQEQILPLKHEERALVVQGILEVSRKELDEEIISTLIAAEGATNPLYISMMIQRLVMLDSEDFGVIKQFGNDMVAINKYLIEVIDTTPFTVEEMSAEVIKEAADRINNDMCTCCAALIAASRRGLREKDLMKILSAMGHEFSAVDFAAFTKYLKPFFIYRHDGRIDFTHRTIRLGFLRQIKFEHYNFYILNHFKTCAFSDTVKVSETVYHALKAQDYEYLTGYIALVRMQGQALQKTTAKELHLFALDEAKYLDRLFVFANNKSTQCDYIEFMNTNFFSEFTKTKFDVQLLALLFESHVKAATAAVQNSKNNIESALCAHNANIILAGLYLERDTIHSYKNETAIFDNEIALEMLQDSYSAVSMLAQKHALPDVEKTLFKILFNLYNVTTNMEYCEKAYELSRKFTQNKDFDFISEHCEICILLLEDYLKSESDKADGLLNEIYDLLMPKGKSVLSLEVNAYYLTLLGHLFLKGYTINNPLSFNYECRYDNEYKKFIYCDCAQEVLTAAVEKNEQIITADAMHENYANYAQALNLYGEFLFEDDMCNEAQGVLNKSLKIYKMLYKKNKSADTCCGLAISFELLARCYDEQAKIELAIDYFKQSYRYYDILKKTYQYGKHVFKTEDIMNLFGNKYGLDKLGAIHFNEEMVASGGENVKAYEYLAEQFDSAYIVGLLITKYEHTIEDIQKYNTAETFEKIIEYRKKADKLYCRLIEKQAEINKSEYTKNLFSLAETLCNAKIGQQKEAFDIWSRIFDIYKTYIKNDDLTAVGIHYFVAVSVNMANYQLKNGDSEQVVIICKDAIKQIDYMKTLIKKLILSADKEYLKYCSVNKDSTQKEMLSEIEYEQKLYTMSMLDVYVCLADAYKASGQFDLEIETCNTHSEIMFSAYAYYTEDESGCKKLCVKYYESAKLAKSYGRLAQAYKNNNDIQKQAEKLECAAGFIETELGRYDMTYVEVNYYYTLLIELFENLNDDVKKQIYIDKKAQIADKLKEYEEAEKKRREERRKVDEEHYEITKDADGNEKLIFHT